MSSMFELATGIPQQLVGYASPGCLSQGRRNELIYVNPGLGQSEYNTNIFNVE